jgi:hypothetical protein
VKNTQAIAIKLTNNANKLMNQTKVAFLVNLEQRSINVGVRVCNAKARMTVHGILILE